MRTFGSGITLYMRGVATAAGYQISISFVLQQDSCGWVCGIDHSRPTRPAIRSSSRLVR